MVLLCSVRLEDQVRRFENRRGRLQILRFKSTYIHTREQPSYLPLDVKFRLRFQPQPKRTIILTSERTYTFESWCVCCLWDRLAVNM
jgi:hypothetical protein